MRHVWRHERTVSKTEIKYDKIFEHKCQNACGHSDDRAHRYFILLFRSLFIVELDVLSLMYWKARAVKDLTSNVSTNSKQEIKVKFAFFAKVCTKKVPKKYSYFMMMHADAIERVFIYP